MKKRKLIYIITVLFMFIFYGCQAKGEKPLTMPKEEDKHSGFLNTYDNSYNSEMPDKGTLSKENEVPISDVIGIGRTNANEAYQDEWGVKLIARDIKSTGLTIICEQSEGEPSGRLQTESPYFLEVLMDGEWVEVELLPSEYELSWTDEAWNISANDSVEWTVDWTRLYGELPTGSYRIGKQIMDFRGTVDYDKKLYYAGFNIYKNSNDFDISYEHAGISISLPYVEGWEYRITEYAQGCVSHGLSFRPVGEDGWIDFHYWESFGVCGTGLKTESYGHGTMGTYDNHAVWDFISFEANKGSFVAMTEAVEGWWQQFGKTAMEILTAAEFYITDK